MPKYNLERSLGRVEGKLDLVINQLTKLSGAFDQLEKGRLSTIEKEFAQLKSSYELGQNQEEKTGSKLWDLAKIVLPIIIMGTMFLITFWIQNQ
jgi:hypothetical protein